ncbi:Sodium:solute symporter family protein, partial [Dethiosulfatibacter aminovorans DSM 17477]
MPVLLSLCALYIVVGYILSKRVNTASDFLVAGRSLPVIVVSFTIAATHFGGGVFVGGIEWGVEKGVWPGAYAGIGLGLTCFISAIIAGKFREIADGITPPDFIEHRYGHSKFLRGYHAIVYILGTVAIIACQFMAFGSMASAFGISYKTAVLLGTVVVIIYTYMAGMWGVAITDFIQLGMCILFIPIIAVLGGQIIAAEHSVTIGDLLSQPF